VEGLSAIARLSETDRLEETLRAAA
jgi:hypothetical protein